MDRAARWTILGLLWLTACAPSPRMVHQNADYFERCQAVDYDPYARPEARQACWARWLRYYTLGQHQDRIRHAEARLAVLRGGTESAPLPGIGDTPSPTRSSTATRGADPSSTPSPAPEADPHEIPSPPTSRDGACGPVCLPGWETCAKACDPHSDPCIKACESEYRTCIAACN